MKPRHERRSLGVIDADLHEAGRPLSHTWSFCVGAGRAHEGLRADWQRDLKRAVAECGFRYIRFHGLFHDDMMVYREDKAGRPVYNWQYIDLLFDALLAIGIRPFVELGFCPRALASKTATVFWWNAHGAPPKSLRKWRALVDQFIRHCIARYGAGEVRRWYFEVWNEPNLAPFFSGTRSQYFRLYEATAQAIKAIDPRLRVGGPATANFVPDSRFDGEREDVDVARRSIQRDPDSLPWHPVWVETFLSWCARRRVPVDFVSTHPYPTDFALVGHGKYRGVSRKRDAVLEDLGLLRRVVRNSPYPKAEIHCTEWNSSPSARDHMHDFPPAAAYIAMANLEGGRYADSLSYWTFTDHFEEDGAGDSLWHGGFGLLNLQGLPKPSFHAYRFLHRLGERLIAQGPGYAVTRHRSGGAVTLLYHYPPEAAQTPPLCKTVDRACAFLRRGRPRRVELRLRGLRPLASFRVERVGASAGWSRGAWEKMGSPDYPSVSQCVRIEAAARPALSTCRADSHGRLSLSLNLSPWELVIVEEIAGRRRRPK